MTGAAFMKFGRAPTTWTTGGDIVDNDSASLVLTYAGS